MLHGTMIKMCPILHSMYFYQISIPANIYLCFRSATNFFFINFILYEISDMILGYVLQLLQDSLLS